MHACDPQYSGWASQSPSTHRTSGRNIVTNSFISGCILFSTYSLMREEGQIMARIELCKGKVYKLFYKYRVTRMVMEQFLLTAL